MTDNKLTIVGNSTPTDLTTTSREDYYQFMREALMEPFSTGHVYSPEEKKRIDSHMRGVSTGASAMIPLHCAGPACPFALRCVYQQMNKAPIGKPCIIEIQLLQHWVIRYMEEYDVDPASFTETGYCNELAELEVMLGRLNQLLSRPENADGTINQMVGVTHDGTPIEQKQISPFVEQKEKLLNRRSKVIKLMVGDRQEKYKKEAALKVKESKDPSSRQAEVRRQIESLQRNLGKIEAEQQQKALPAGSEGIDQIFDPPVKTPEMKDLEAVLTPNSLIADEEG